MKKVKILTSLLVSLTILTSFAACSKPTTNTNTGTEPTKKASGKLVIYTGAGPEITDPILAEFKKQYPDITTEIVKAGSGELLARIKAEKGNAGGDVLLGGEPFAFESNKDLFQAYESATDKDMVAVDANHVWHPFSIMPQAILVNKNLIKDESKYPKTLKELEDPKWKQIGKIAFADPNKSGTGATIVNGMVSLYGWDYVENLLKNAEVMAGSDPMFNAVKDGTAPLGFMNEDLGLKWEKMGLPVKMIFPEDGVTNQIDALAIINGAKNIDNAKLFIDFFGSKVNHQILRDKILRRSTRKDVTPAEGMVDISKLKLIETKPLSRDEIGKNFNERLDKVRK
jgi:iron(III) transport system substrate-binding protein